MVKTFTVFTAMLFITVCGIDQYFANPSTITGFPYQDKKRGNRITLWSIIKRPTSYALTKRSMSWKSIDKMITDSMLLVDTLPNKNPASLLIPGEGNAIIYFAGIGRLQTGTLFVKEFNKTLVNTFSTSAKPPLASSVGFTFNGQKYRVSVEVGEKRKMRIYLTRGKRRQLLCLYPEVTDAIVLLNWIADVDRDGLPDFLLRTSNHYADLTYRLYLSSRARKGDLVREVARYSQDC